MTDPSAPPPPKAPPSDLAARAPRPRAVRLRKPVVQAVVMSGAVLVSGSLAWAFVVQPEMREAARERKAEAREDGARGAVRPSDAVTDQPASYDRLPEPRIGKADDPTAPEAVAATQARAPTPMRAAAPAVSRPSGPSAAMLAARSGLFFETASLPAQAAAGSGPAPAGRGGALNPDYGAVYNGHSLIDPLSPFELKAGAMIPAALLTGVDTAREGPVVATVTQNVFDSISGRHLLVPQGSRLIGRSEGSSAYGDRRAFITWERLILPNGRSLLLSSEAGVDAQGAVGVRGEADRRILPLLVGTLFAGAITALGQIARDGEDGGGLLGDAGDAAAIQGAQVGGRLVDRELEVRPSIRLRPGALVRVMITRDLILEPYRP